MLLVVVQMMYVKYAVKKAYYKLSLPFHPEIAGNKFRAARKFQALGKVYDVLSDVNKRRLYNREGCCSSHLIPAGFISVLCDNDF